MNTISQADYNSIFEDKVFSLFEYFEREEVYGVDVYHVYKYTFMESGRSYRLAVNAKIRTKQEILRIWLEAMLGQYQQNTLYKIYKYVNIDNLSDFIQILIYMKIYVRREKLDIAFSLIKTYSNLTNIKIKEYLEKFVEIYNIHNDNLKSYKIFESEIISLNNQKISELWWIWRDYTNEYNSYIEWLPRETLSDFLEVQNSGVSQPDYSSYI